MPGTMGRRLALAAALFAATATTALAHPHVFVDAAATVVFDADGKITAIRNVWRFDDAYSAFATQGLDTDGDGKYSIEELKPLAEINVESLEEYAYFTFLTAGAKDIDFNKPTEYWLQWDDGYLTLYFTVPTKEPVEIRSLPAKLEVYDPTYFVSFLFVEKDPITLENPPESCGYSVIKPEELDPATAATLAEIPMDQREIPSELQLITQDLTNGADLKCP